MTQQSQKNTRPSSGGTSNFNIELPKPRAVHFGKMLAQIVKDLEAYGIEHVFYSSEDGKSIVLAVVGATIDEDGDIVDVV